jgi:hypothetical protein
LENSSAFAVHNLSDRQRTVRLELDDEEFDRALEMFDDRTYERPTGRELCLDPYGYRWFRIQPPLLP